MTPTELRTARKSLSLTQGQLAAVLGYGSQSRVAELEAGTFAPGPAVVRLIAAYIAGYRPPDWP